MAKGEENINTPTPTLDPPNKRKKTAEEVAPLIKINPNSAER